MPQSTMRSLKLIGENSTPTNASPDLGAAGSGTSRSSTPSTASPYFTTWAAFIANSSHSASNERLPRSFVNATYQLDPPLPRVVLTSAGLSETATATYYRRPDFITGALGAATRRYSDLSLTRCN